MHIYIFLFFSKTVIVASGYLDEPDNFCEIDSEKRSTFLSGIQAVPGFPPELRKGRISMTNVRES